MDSYTSVPINNLMYLVYIHIHIALQGATRLVLFVGRFKASISLDQGKVNNTTIPPAALYTTKQSLEIGRYC